MCVFSTGYLIGMIPEIRYCSILPNYKAWVPADVSICFRCIQQFFHETYTER